MATAHGYLQSVDEATLLRVACAHETIVRMDCGVGAFVVENSPLASLALENPPDEEIVAALRAGYNIDRHRTVHQDCAFGIRQLVDIALRALSPGINDTTTALMCVDYLTAVLARLVSRDIPPSHHYDNGELRVIYRRQTFASLVAESFDEIRGCASGNATVMLKMLAALQTIASLTNLPGRRRVLREQVDCIAELAGRSIEAPHDRARLERLVAATRHALQQTAGSIPEKSPPDHHSCRRA
jgi:uncharacterized membrane protein